MNNLLIAIAVFVITVVGALFAVPYFVDWNSYRAYFEEEATRVIGREVQVDGNVKLHLLPTPYFRIEKVRIADAASASLTEPFFKTESLSVKLSVPPLFRGIIEANDIEFEEPVLRVALDSAGQWNWQGFARALSAAAYMPSNVTLTSLKISNGTLALHGPDGSERTRLEGLQGVLSAPDLAGPYRVRGSFRTAGGEREFRMATGTPEADGGVRVRASLRMMDSGATYLLDARLADLMGKPRVDGELTARIPVAGLWDARKASPAPARPKAAAASPDEEHKLDSMDAAFDLKAAIQADVDGMQLSDLALSFEQGGRPQLITGTVQASWRDAVALDMRLGSRWLDLDRITGAADGAGPLSSIVKIASGMRDVLPGYRSRLVFSVDQANLGGEAIAGVQVSLVRAAQAMQLEYVRATLPGSSNGELKGAFTGSAEALAFAGDLRVRGSSAARFAAWATGGTTGDAKGDGPFSLETQLVLDPGRIEAKAFVGTLSDTVLKGSALYDWSGNRPELSVALEGPQLDARSFVQAGSDLPGVLALLTSRHPDAAAGSTLDMRLALKTGLLLTAGRSYRDVAASLQMEGGHLKQLLLRLAGDEGYAIEVTGRLNDALTQPKGTLRGSISATTAAGVSAAIDLLGVPASIRPDATRAQALTPLQLAGTLAFAGRAGMPTDLLADGQAGGMSAKLLARLEGGPRDWKGKGADIAASLDAPDPSKLAALLFGAGAKAGARGEKAGRILIKAAGIPAQGLASVVTIAAGEDLAAEFRGQLKFAEPATKADGDLEIRAADGADLLALIGSALPLPMDGAAVSARLKLALDGGMLGLKDIAAQIGSARIAGQLALSRTGKRRRIDAKLQAEEVSLAQLIAPLLDQRLAVAGLAETALSGRQGPWPDVPFAAAALDGIEGRVEIDCNRLVFTDRLALDGARLRIGLSPGRIEVSELAGAALGGKVSAKVTIARIPAGVEVSGKATMDAALDRLTGPEPSSTPGGSMRASLEFGGRGTSPRGVIAALQGKGSLDLRDAKLVALWPGAVALAADAGLKAEPDKLSAVVRQVVASGLASGVVPIGAQPVALEIGNGQLHTKSLVIETEEGRASGTASLDLASLDFRSQWRLEARPPPANTATKRLPAVGVEYAGPVAALGTLTPRIDSAALEQEVSARKIERDVEELERLRKLDEQRRAMESERLRRQFEQTPPVQRPSLPPGVPVAPSGRDQQPAAPG